MADQRGLRITCLYFALFVIALIYGMGLIKKAYHYKEADLVYTEKEIILEDKALRLTLADGSITMYHRNTQFTEFNGMAYFFTVKGIEYATLQASWMIEKMSPLELYATLEWPGLPLRQLWHLSLKGEELDWQIDLESDDDITMRSLGVGFFLKNNYQEWISPFEQGRMPLLEVFQQLKNLHPPVASNAFGFIAGGKKAQSFPMVELSVKKGMLAEKVLLSSFRDAYSRTPCSNIYFGSEGPLRVLKKSKIPLSSGRIVLFDEKDDLLDHLMRK